MASYDAGLKLNTRRLSCYCKVCKTGEGICKNLRWVEPGKTQTLTLDIRAIQKDCSEIMNDSNTPEDVVNSASASTDSHNSASTSAYHDDQATTYSNLGDSVPTSITGKPNGYVGVKLSGKRHRSFWYMAMVLEIGADKSAEAGHVKVSFMTRGKDGAYTWPQPEDIFWQPRHDVIFCCNPPNATKGSRTRLSYQFDFTEQQLVTTSKLPAK